MKKNSAGKGPCLPARCSLNCMQTHKSEGSEKHQFPGAGGGGSGGNGTCTPSTWDSDAGRSLQVQGQPCLQSEFQESQEYTEKLSKTKQNKTNLPNRTNKETKQREPRQVREWIPVTPAGKEVGTGGQTQV